MTEDLFHPFLNMQTRVSKHRLAIIGGGAAGFFAAANLAGRCENLEIVIYESSSKFLAKVEISGGGRCNVTHSCFDISKLIEAYPRGRHELIGPFRRFSPTETIEWFKERDEELKTESDGRMFPSSDSSQSIISCLMKCVESKNVVLHSRLAVKSAISKAEGFELLLGNGKTDIVNFVLIATGSSKSGHSLASSFGHNITKCSPSLFTFKSKDERLVGLEGISLKDASLKLEVESKSFKQSGPLLITHWGLSGPAVLKLSAFAADKLANLRYRAKLVVNWLGQLKDQDCIDQIAKLRKSSARKEVGASPQFGLTRRLWERLLIFSEIPLQLHFFELSNQQIRKLCDTLLRSEIMIEGKGEFKEEFVTCGGVDLKQIDFHNFESKIISNVFFAGEILNIDGITGGYNFQAAWTGAWIVAQAIAKRV